MRLKFLVLVVALSHEAQGFKPLLVTRRPYRSWARWNFLHAEPIPVGTVMGNVEVKARSLEPMVRNVDRTLKLFPSDLDGTLDGQPVDRQADLAAVRSRLVAEKVVEGVGFEPMMPPFSFTPVDGAVAVLFTVVLWFGVLNDLLFPRAMRPSDVVVPALGRLLGFEGQWLDDFDNSSRGEFPPALLCVALPLFYAGGCAVELLARGLFGGDGSSEEAALFAGQLGVIGCIWAGVYEVGRVDTGDALLSRVEDDERQRVRGEFEAFASEHLERCSDEQSTNAVLVLRLFRRTHARHRRPDQEGSAPDGLVTEALRAWHQEGYGRARDRSFAPGGLGSEGEVSLAPPPTSSGFFKGVRIREASMGLMRF